jgi:hypothetical protein
MKNLFIASFILLNSFAFAQQPIVIDLVHQTTDNVPPHLAYVVLIPQAPLNDTEKNWSRNLSKDSRGGSDDNNGVHTQKKMLFENVSSERFEMYSRMKGTVEGVQLSVWLTQNGRALISNAPETGLDLAVRKYVYDFAIEQYRYAVQVELKKEQEKQKKMEDELSDLLKSKEESIETITENEREEKRTAAAIDVTNKHIDNTALEIHDQKQIVKATAADPNTQKGPETTLDNMQDDKQDLQKDNRKKNEDLEELRKDSRVAARTMNINEQDVALKTAAIEAHKQTVRDVLAKLNNIK